MTSSDNYNCALCRLPCRLSLSLYYYNFVINFSHAQFKFNFFISLSLSLLLSLALSVLLHWIVFDCTQTLDNGGGPIDIHIHAQTRNVEDNSGKTILAFVGKTGGGRDGVRSF